MPDIAMATPAIFFHVIWSPANMSKQQREMGGSISLCRWQDEMPPACAGSRLRQRLLSRLQGHQHVHLAAMRWHVLSKLEGHQPVHATAQEEFK